MKMKFETMKISSFSDFFNISFFKDVEEIRPDIDVRNKGRPPLTFLC